MKRDRSSELNVQQREAVEAMEGPVLVVAGAGSGKTKVVTERIFRMLDLGVPSTAILAVTFTNKAAQEMRERVSERCGRRVSVSTFHSLGAQILRECSEELEFAGPLVIYDEDDSLRALCSCLQDLSIDSRKEIAKALKAKISHAKNALLGPADVDDTEAQTEIDHLFPSVYAEYQQRLKLSGAVDFDDLLYLPVQMFESKPEVLARYQQRWTFFSVDEFQDTNAAQYRLIQLLAAKSRNLCVVGDPDQSIYSWRGADIRNILNFSHDYPGCRVIRLEQNYRSTQTILEAAADVIQHNTDRLEKRLWSAQGTGDLVEVRACQSERDEAETIVEKVLVYHQTDHVALREMAIFYRTNFQSRIFEDVLLREQIPYVIYGGISFYQRKEIKDVLAYLRVSVCPADTVAFSRTINYPKRGVGDKSIAQLLAGAVSHHLPVVEYAHRLVLDEIPGGKATARQKKGLVPFLEVVEQIQTASQQGVASAVRCAIDHSGILEALRVDPVTYDDRKANIDELLTKASEWELENQGRGLSDFIEELALKGSTDVDSQQTDCLSLLTLHNSKGLEFDTCFMAGMEEGLFPHFNSRDEQSGLEEERRLCYVGMTRARRQLHMTYATSRQLYGSYRRMPRSRFLGEISDQHMRSVGYTVSDTAGWGASAATEVDEEYQHAAELDPEETVVGDRVVHQEFGVGTVEAIGHGQLGPQFDIRFDKLGETRTLAVRYAQLRLSL